MVKDHWLKVARIWAYLLMGAAGVLLLVSPIFREAFPDTASVMSIFLAVGGTLSMLGALSERWYGEYVGIPLLAAGFAVFAVLSLDSMGNATFIALANFSLLMALTASLLGRWREVRVVYRLAVHMAEKEQG